MEQRSCRASPRPELKVSSSNGCWTTPRLDNTHHLPCVAFYIPVTKIGKLTALGPAVLFP